MNQHTATGLPPVHHDHAEARYALTEAGHVALAPTGAPPAPGVVVLSCIDCDHVYEPHRGGPRRRAHRLPRPGLRRLDLLLRADRARGWRCPMTAEKHKPLATCARCARVIDAGEPYVVITMQWERMRRKRITVRHAEALAYVHEDCAEGLTEQVANAIGGVGS